MQIPRNIVFFTLLENQVVIFGFFKIVASLVGEQRIFAGRDETNSFFCSCWRAQFFKQLFSRKVFLFVRSFFTIYIYFQLNH